VNGTSRAQAMRLKEARDVEIVLTILAVTPLVSLPALFLISCSEAWSMLRAGHPFGIGHNKQTSPPVQGYV
jgi:hypothetical protein